VGPRKSDPTKPDGQNGRQKSKTAYWGCEKREARSFWGEKKTKFLNRDTRKMERRNLLTIRTSGKDGTGGEWKTISWTT